MNRKSLFRRRRCRPRDLNHAPAETVRAESLEPRTLLAFGLLGPEFRVNTTTAGDQVGAAIAADALGNFVVAWSGPGQDPASAEVYARRYSAAGDPLGDEFLVNTTTAGDQKFPAVAADAAGDFVVAWMGIDAAGSGLYAQRYGAGGSPQGGEFRIDAPSSPTYGTPAVAMDADGDFVVAWNGSPDAIVARRFDAAGRPLGDQFAVSDEWSWNPPAPLEEQYGASVAMDANGDLVIAWTYRYFSPSYYDYGYQYQVRMQRYDSAGGLSGLAELDGDGQSPCVAAGANGDSVVAWDTNDFGSGIVALRTAGQGAGGLFAIGSYAIPSAALAADGTVLIAWTQWDADSSAYNVHGQRFDAANQPLGAAFRVNTSFPSGYPSPVVSPGAAGGFVVAWNSLGQDGSGWGVYGQRFGEGGAPPPPPPPSISVGDVSVTEGNTGTTSAAFTVGLSSASDQTVTVGYATADAGALAGSDYVAASGTLTFAPGETSKTVPVAVRGDTVDEFDQGFVLNLSNATNGIIADSQGLATILDDDAPPTIAINDVSRSEGHRGTTAFTFTVSLSAASEKTVQASFSTANGTATLANSDYFAASGTLVFAPGQTSATIVVQVIGDRRKEANEYFLVNLLGVSNALIGDGQGRGNILNDDGPG